MQNGANNLFLNSDSHHNYDPLTSNGAGQSADGFGAHISANQPGNIFRGCRAWSNSDDGFDLINAYSPVVIENSWAWSHGYLPGTTTSLAAGNGNGFKIGGYGGIYVKNAVSHTVRNSVAFRNKAAGFYANHHPVANVFSIIRGLKTIRTSIYVALTPGARRLGLEHCVTTFLMAANHSLILRVLT